jgi:hypothetical protein
MEDFSLSTGSRHSASKRTPLSGESRKASGEMLYDTKGEDVIMVSCEESAADRK